ncbi:MAG: hypothetical protein M3O31_14865 [Acidobacteriota bacterium]|nr:hypothetical protein [Acidobacteriota bacterium]
MLISPFGRGLLLSISASLFCFAVGPTAQGQSPQTQGQTKQPAESPESMLEELAAIKAAEAINDSGPSGMIPAAKGFNASVGTVSQHDSANGWSSFLTPELAYRFNRYLSVAVYAPIHTYINLESNIGTEAKPVYTYAVHGGIVGDTTLSFEGNFSTFTTSYSGTFSLGLPSGDTVHGLGAGEVTYNFNNHFERSFGIFTPDIELGVGNTSNLIDQRILKSYIAVGPISHFQAGTYLDLPWRMSFEANAYEELPLDTNIVYSTTTRGKQKITTATNIDPGEDNGFITSLDIPMWPHVTLSGFYNRSLRNHDDISGFSLTYILRVPPRPVDSMH